MQVPQGLQWPLNQLALENCIDDWVEDWARNPSPSGGLCWVYLTSSPVFVNFDALEWLWTHFKTEPIAPQEKGAKKNFLSKIGHSDDHLFKNYAYFQQVSFLVHYV